MAHVLTINGGSSSIRFAIYDGADCRGKLLDGKLERIGAAGTTMVVSEAPAEPVHIEVPAGEVAATIDFVVQWLERHPSFAAVAGIGHRIVHGMQHVEPERLTAALLEELRRMSPFDPEHMPRELELIDAFRARHPEIPQAVCFDTSFHRTMPRVATQLPLPRRYEAQGVQRYGFHGLSYGYLMSELLRLGDPAAVHGRIILAHLGSGASLAAVLDGRCIDTSMGFTPSAGLMMSTRSGDLDPGLVAFLAAREGMDAAAFQKMTTHEAGLLGVSETSADIRDLLECERRDPRAAEAVALFCYQARKWIGAFAAVLGGVDLLVFAGGIGEHAATIRARICADLSFLGIELDADRNERHLSIISAPGAGAVVRIVPTDEESVIAASTLRVLNL